jgi:RHS repeat-associated protein
MTDGAGSEAWAYDTMGRAVVDQRTTNSVTRTFTYGYTYDGTVNSITYPSGHVITYDIKGARRPDWAKDTGSGINYATSATYWPQGATKTATYGGVISRSDTYNNRLQPTSLTATVGSTSLLNLSYSFTDGSGHNNGNVMSITNYPDTNRSQFFTYDKLNRIATAYTQGNSPNPNCWGLSYGYDIWANLTTATVTKCTATSLSISVGANNRISTSGYAYDVAGNLTSDPLHSYVYDAENHQTSAAGVTYTYDGDGRRVKKENGKLYWYGLGREVLTETDLGGNYPTEYVFFGGRRIARRDPSGTVYYYFGDHLGTSRVIVQAGQTAACYEADYYPYGGERLITNTCPQNYKFTGKERDTETQNDYFGARYYASNLGRFLHTDPGPFLWTDAQSLNRYAYTRNNPLKFVDPTGRYFVVAPEMQAQVKRYISAMLRSPHGAEIIRAISANPKPNFFTLGQLDRHPVAGTNKIAVTTAATTWIAGSQPGQLAGTQTVLSNSNIAFAAARSTGDIFAVGLKAFAHDTAHVVDINAGRTLQQSISAGIAGDAPSKPGAEDTVGGSAEARADQVMDELGDAGQTFQPDANADADAEGVIQYGMQEYQKDLEQLFRLIFRYRGMSGRSD